MIRWKGLVAFGWDGSNYAVWGKSKSADHDEQPMPSVASEDNIAVRWDGVLLR